MVFRKSDQFNPVVQPQFSIDVRAMPVNSADADPQLYHQFGGLCSLQQLISKHQPRAGLMVQPEFPVRL